MFPDTSKGSPFLKARVNFAGEYQECQVVETYHDTQTAEVIPLGSLFHAFVPFSKIANVSLSYPNGEVIENYGSPRNVPMRQYEPAPAHKAAQLAEAPKYFERDYCPECMKIHMVEKTRRGQVICHGIGYYMDAQANRTHYTRRLGKGFELVAFDRQYPLDWQMAFEAKEPEYIDVDQDW
jgi:hypothetical protein